jgi:hypothetical protein
MNHPDSYRQYSSKQRNNKIVKILAKGLISARFALIEHNRSTTSGKHTANAKNKAKKL